MDTKIFILILYFGGMIALGIATSVIARSVTGQSKEDRSTARLISGWGMVFTVAWFVYGGVITLGYLTK